MWFWRWIGRPAAWLIAAVVLILLGSDLRPWLDGDDFRISTPVVVWRKLERVWLEVNVAVRDVVPMTRGLQCLRERDYVCAEFMLTRQLETSPGDRRAIGALAIAQQRQSKYADAIVTAEKAFAMGEGNFELFQAYAVSLENSGRAADATKWWTRALGVAPRSYEAHEALVKLLLEQSKPDEALALAVSYDTAMGRRGRRPVFVAQRLLAEEMLSKQSGQPRRAKAELRIARLDDHFHAPVKLGESHFAAFMVDTGATFTTLSRAVLETSKAASTMVDRNAEAKLADGRRLKGARVRLAELRVGQIVLRGIEAFVCDTCELLLGQSSLQNFNLQQLRIEGVDYLIMTER